MAKNPIRECKRKKPKKKKKPNNDLFILMCLESFCGDAREFHCERGVEARWKIKLNPLQGDKSGLAPAFIDPKGDDVFDI